MKKKLTESGAKDYQRNDSENRSEDFRKMHRNLDRKLYATDIDLVEMRIINGELTAVGTLEITRIDNDKKVSKRYLESILKRYERDFQKKMACYLAEKLGVKAWIVLYKEDLSQFWIYCLSNDDNRWYYYDVERFEKWLKNLEKGINLNSTQIAA